MSHDAFISYSSQDKAAADATCAALEASGIRCWIAPRDIMPGTEWGAAIIDAINHCRVMILIFSANANDSPQIRREVERAVNKGISIIPLRIEDIAPTHSLEYFIGTVHWLDALTPPLQAHLQQLSESVKTLLQIAPALPRIVVPASGPSASAASSLRPDRRVLAMLVSACLGLSAAGIGIWWFVAAKAPQSEPVASAPPAQPPAQPVTQTSVDPALVGTFAHDAVVDNYDWHLVYSVAANGTYRLVTTADEAGTFQAANGLYRTTDAKTGRVRQGTYRAVGGTAMEVTSAGGAALYRPTQPTAPLDPTHPVMLGIWRATISQGGVTWVMTIQNNPDGTFRYQARAEDSGTCAFAGQQWHSTSALTGQSYQGTYRIVDPHNVEIIGPDGPAMWQRQ